MPSLTWRPWGPLTVCLPRLGSSSGLEQALVAALTPFLPCFFFQSASGVVCLLFPPSFLFFAWGACEGSPWVCGRRGMDRFPGIKRAEQRCNAHTNEEGTFFPPLSLTRHPTPPPRPPQNHLRAAPLAPRLFLSRSRRPPST